MIEIVKYYSLIIEAAEVQALEVVLHHNAVAVEVVEEVIGNPLNYDIVVDIMYCTFVVD